MTYSGTLAEAIATVERLAVESFASHQLRELTPPDARARVWHCGRPNSGQYSFRVVATSGVLFIYGDLGECVIRCSESRPIGWLTDAIGSRDYLLGKVSQDCVRTAFYCSDATAEQRRLADEAAANERDPHRLQTADRIRDGWSPEDGEDAFFVMLADVGQESAGVRVRGPTAHLFWIYEALKWFVAAEQRAAVAA